MSKALIRMKKHLEIEFLKSKSYEEINDMFNELSRKLELSNKEIKRLKKTYENIL